MIWFYAIRPKTLPAALCPVFIGTTLALTAGCFHLMTFCLTLITALGIQISCNLLNDYQDFLKGADTAEREGPIRVTAAGLVSISTMKKASLCTLIFTALAGSYLVFQGGWVIALLLAISLLLAFCYTAGPLPLAYLGLGDLFVLIFFGPIAVIGTYFLQTGHFSLNALMAGWGPGAFSTAILIANNLRDEKEDSKHLKKTLVVRFGSRFGKWEYVAALCIALLLPLYFFSSHPFSLLASLTFLPSLLAIHTLFTAEKLASLLPKTARLLLLYSLLFCIGWML